MKIEKLQAARHTVQLLFIGIAMVGFYQAIEMTGFIYPFFFCYSCPGAWASCPIGIMEHAFINMREVNFFDGLKLLLYLLGFVSIFGIIFGRFICGWACPIGTIQDLVAFIRSKIFKKELPKLYNLRFVKYIILALIPATSYLMTRLFYTEYCPVGGITGTSLRITLENGDWIMGPEFPFKIISVTLFFIFIAVVGRGWCRWLCPLGAWLSLYNKISPLSIHVDEEKCVGCNACSKQCPMQIDIPAEKDSLECIGCTKCVGVCKFDAHSLRFFNKEVAK